ncbi:MAG TPA: D-2-hydroxyacid dehydrogenase family protein [Burkholderiales bacterium]|nr:D-2-hydroxyacid dehydrogenase family protein [Burkholderiales bacterium]
MKLAILDDYQRLALRVADWKRLSKRGIEITVFNEAFGSADEAAAKLAPFDILCLMRERTPFPRTLIERLPNLRFMALTGLRAPSLDLAACTARRIPVSNTGAGNTNAPTAELTWLLVIAAARDFARAERGVRAGRWHDGLAGGVILEGKRLGLLGLGKLGARVARYGLAFGMDVVAWSQNLTPERAAAAGAHPVSKDVLLETSDVVSIHLVLSERTRALLGATEFARMKPGAILVNTSRGPIVDEAAMLAALKSGHLGHAALDVYDREPLPAGHALRALQNVTLSPHLGYVSEDVFRGFYADAIEDIEAWLAGTPIRVMNPEALA